MADVPHTLILGDEIGRALYDAFQTIPGTGAIWQKTFVGSGNTIGGWANAAYAENALADIAAGRGGTMPPDQLPDTALVSLGRNEILSEPDNISADALKTIAGDVTKLVDQLQGLKLKVAWVMPPLAQKEGKARAAIETALASKGVRFFASEHRFTDPSSRGGDVSHFEKPKADGTASDTVQQMADLITTWLPLGPPRGVIVPRHDGSIVADAGGYLSRFSTPAKVGLVVGGLAIVGGAIYAARRYG